MSKNDVENGNIETMIDEEFANTTEPIKLFESWMKDATEKEVNDPTAMSLATVDESGMPNVRMVLLKDAGLSGFTFYTNYESAKGRELIATPKAALCFHWKSLRRQIRIRGEIIQVEAAEADEYFDSRPKGSRIGAWASQQSRELESRFALEKSVAQFTAKYAMGKVPRPEYWSGFRLLPVEIEFWRDRPFRLHDRLVFRRSNIKQNNWSRTRLYP